MEIIVLNDGNLADWQEKARRNVIALGFFDGVHKGHQKVIETARREAERAGVPLDVMSFFPHPKTVLSGGKVKVDYLIPLEEKARLLEEMGVDRFYIVTFTKAFASLSPEAYVEQYLLTFGTDHAVAGYDFSYGFKGEGTIDRLHADSGGRIGVSKVEEVQYRREKISSTRIRAAILGGRIAEVKQLLGRCYTTRAEVSGDCLSLKEYYMLPQSGIYNVRIGTGSAWHDSQIYVDSEEQTISFMKQCLLKQIDQQEIAIEWESRVATHSLYEPVAQ
ncbi:riboflavin biosynthesis protein RibF [Bhargavaea cecembensis]|uniref:FAD synthase n=1 Tax=Bhargavaea cecembensis TaxID=394098 RepID=A0A163ETY7_9BACL|nr:FAD synthetase family protein [Bhargavaea cecembensis]KZE37176.1 riboflavin biosynthesis protein RibF [Bhargavaea cecembensis]